jgi:hypothetical protein
MFAAVNIQEVKARYATGITCRSSRKVAVIFVRFSRKLKKLRYILVQLPVTDFRENRLNGSRDAETQAGGHSGSLAHISATFRCEHAKKETHYAFCIVKHLQCKIKRLELTG